MIEAVKIPGCPMGQSWDNYLSVRPFILEISGAFPPKVDAILGKFDGNVDLSFDTHQ